MQYTDYNFQGRQPVRVLENNVLAWFEEKYPEFRQELEDIFRYCSRGGEIELYRDEVSVKDGIKAYVNPDGKICLHETFLSYIWALSYSFMVIFDEEVHSLVIRQQPNHGKGIGHFVPKARKVLSYGFSLRNEFQRWPETLPNPENYNECDIYYVEKANGIYVAAVDFILSHEVGHIACDHFRKLEKTPDKRKELEQEADLWALDRVLKGIKLPKRTKTTVGFGVIAGLGSLLFLNSKLTQHDYPDNDERIANIMTGLDIDDIESLWGVAVTFFLLWKEIFGIRLNISSEFNTYKEFFQDIICQLQPLKRSAGFVNLD